MSNILPDVTSPEELSQYDDGDLYGRYDGWEHDESLIAAQRLRLEEIFDLPFEMFGREASQDGSLLAVLYSPEACRIQRSENAFDLSLLSFDFSMFGRLFTCNSTSEHPSVNAHCLAHAIDVFRGLGFRFCPAAILNSRYDYEIPEIPTWGHRYFCIAF